MNRWAWITAAPLLWTACANEAVTPPLADAPALARHAVVHVEARSPRTTGVQTAPVVSAQVVAFRGVEREPLFAALGLWTDWQGAEACHIVDESILQSHDIEVHFDDVGPLWLGIQGQQTLLQPRLLPSWDAAVTGAVYHGALAPASVVEGGTLHVQFPAQVGTQAIVVPVPEVVRIATVNGVDPGSSPFLPVERTQPIWVDIDASTPTLTLWLRPSEGTPWPLMECRVPSQEPLMLDPGELARWFGDRPLELSVLARTIRRTSLDAQTPVDVVYDVRDVLVLQR